MRSTATKKRLYESNQSDQILTTICSQLAFLTSTVDTLVACITHRDYNVCVPDQSVLHYPFGPGATVYEALHEGMGSSNETTSDSFKEADVAGNADPREKAIPEKVANSESSEVCIGCWVSLPLHDRTEHRLCKDCCALQQYKDAQAVTSGTGGDHSSAPVTNFIELVRGGSVKLSNPR